MKNYKVVVHPIECEDGSVSWGATIPATGTVGGGDTPDEAVREAFDNLDYHIEAMKKDGLILPAEDGNVNYSGKFQIRISPRLHEAIAQMAETNGISMNAYVAEAVAWYSGQNIGRKIAKA
jgi:predicted HicB family RNase H-like nuclease